MLSCVWEVDDRTYREERALGWMGVRLVWFFILEKEYESYRVRAVLGVHVHTYPAHAACKTCVRCHVPSTGFWPLYAPPLQQLVCRVCFFSRPFVRRVTTAFVCTMLPSCLDQIQTSDFPPPVSLLFLMIIIDHKMTRLLLLLNMNRTCREPEPLVPPVYSSIVVKCTYAVSCEHPLLFCCLLWFVLFGPSVYSKFLLCFSAAAATALSYCCF